MSEPNSPTVSAKLGARIAYRRIYLLIYDYCTISKEKCVAFLSTFLISSLLKLYYILYYNCCLSIKKFMECIFFYLEQHPVWKPLCSHTCVLTEVNLSVLIPVLKDLRLGKDPRAKQYREYMFFEQNNE